MRTAADFNRLYATPDPWRATRHGYRERILRNALGVEIKSRDVLELGCGEGHLTETLFAGARHVTGIDISDIAIERARARKLQNADFASADFLETSFAGFDVIVARECSGKTLVLTGPIVGGSENGHYFTESRLAKLFSANRMSVKSRHNLRVARRGALSALMDWTARLAPAVLPLLPESAVFQRCYIIRMM